MLKVLRGFFATPGRQAAGWALLGITGVLFATLGAYFLLSDSGDSQARTGDATATAQATATPSPTPSATPTRVGLTATALAQQSLRATQTAAAAVTPSPAPPTATPTPPSVQQPPPPQGSGGNDDPEPTPEPTATPTEEPAPTPDATPVESNLVYCDTTGGGGTPPAGIFGTVTIAGEPAPAGTLVSLAFNGVPSLSAPVTIDEEAAGYRFLFGAGGGGCTNQAGATIEVIVNGQSFVAPSLVGGSEAIRLDVVLE